MSGSDPVKMNYIFVLITFQASENIYELLEDWFEIVMIIMHEQRDEMRFTFNACWLVEIKLR